MFKDAGVGRMTFTLDELSDKTGLDRHTISKNNSSLIRKEFATQRTTQVREDISKCFKKETIYFLEKIGQAIVFTLKQHENKIQEHDVQIADLYKKLEERDKTVKTLIERISELEKEKAKEDLATRTYAFE